MRILTTDVCETPLFRIDKGVEIELPDDIAVAFIADGKAKTPDEPKPAPRRRK